jgi:hypothetical protein
MELVKTERHVVLFATPCRTYENSVDFTCSILETQAEMARRHVGTGLRILGGGHWTDIARNELTDYFLTSEFGFTDLFFIDADQGWDARVVMRFLLYPQGVVAGLPPKKVDPPQFHSNAITGVIENGLFQALEAGTGFMRIKRSVFERMEAAYPELEDLMKGEAPWPHKPYFQAGNTKYGRIGEDIFFCRQLVAMGEYIWIDSDIDFTHRGSKLWRGNFYEHAVEKGLLVKESKAG